MTKTGKDVVELMKRNGCRIERISGSHYIMTNGEKMIPVPVHGNRDLPTGTYNKILKQAGLK